MEWYWKLFKLFEGSNILLNRITKKIENKTNEQKRGFLGMLSGTLRASLLGDILTGKGMLRAGYGNKEEKEILRAGWGNKKNNNSALSFNNLWQKEVLS